MAKICQHCSKGAQVGNTIPKSKLHTKRRFGVNLQRFRIGVNGGERVLLCGSCRSTLQKEPVLVSAAKPATR